MIKYQDTVLSASATGDKGAPVFQAQVRVLKADSTPAQLYSDNGVTTLAQPVLTDSLGRFAFYVADGTYSIVVADPAGANPVTETGVQIFDVSGISSRVDSILAIPSAIITSINTAGTTQTGLVNAAGATQVGLVNAAGAAILSNSAFIAQSANTTAALAGTVDGQLATVWQESVYYQDTYRHTGSYLTLGYTAAIGAGVALEAALAAFQASSATPQFLTPPNIRIVPNDGLKNRNAIIPNRMNSAVPTRNLYQLPSLITPNGGTVTPNYAGNDLRVQMTAGNFPALFNDSVAADYHVRFQVRSNTGAGSQTFKIIKNGDASVLRTVNTTEGSVTDVDMTVTGATAVSLFVASGDASADILVNNIVVVPIELAAPQTSVPATGALVNSAKLSKPGQMTIARGALIGPYTGFVKMSADGNVPVSIAAGTFIATFKKTGATTVADVPGPFMAASPSVDVITLGEQNAQMQWSTPGSITVGGKNASTVLDGKGFVTMSMSFDASGSTIYIDGIPIGTGPGGSAVNVARFWWGGGPGLNGSIMPSEMGPLSIWTNERLSDVAMTRAVAVHRAELTLGGSLPGIRNFLLPDGDSITAGQLVGVDGAYVSLAGLQLGLMYRNQAIAGSTLADLVTRKPAMLNRIRAAVAVGIRPIVPLMIGVNAFPVIADYQAYIDELRTAGAYVILCTCTGSGPQSDASKNAYNASLRLMRYDGLADIAAKVDPVSGYALGSQAAAATTALFPDGLHPSAYGNQLMRDVMRPALAAAML